MIRKVGAKTAMTIMAMQDGGFVVADAVGDAGSYRPYLLACTTLREALEYVRGEMGGDEPEKTIYQIAREADRAER